MRRQMSQPPVAGIGLRVSELDELEARKDAPKLFIQYRVETKPARGNGPFYGEVVGTVVLGNGTFRSYAASYKAESSFDVEPSIAKAKHAIEMAFELMANPPLPRSDP